MNQKADALIILVGVTVIATSALFLWAIPELWMEQLFISNLAWVGMFWFTCFWATQLVFPFIKASKEDSSTEEKQESTNQRKDDQLPKRIVTVGIPIFSICLGFISLLFHPLSWIGVFIIIMFNIILLNELRLHGYFTLQKVSLY